MKHLLLLFFLGQCFLGNSQWFNPENHLEGQAWPAEVKSAYDRLPARAEQSVTKQVWRLQSHGAGLMFRFRSNATEIKVRYGVSDSNYALDHMPATGKSGVDLYAIDSDGAEKWCAASRNFGDTILYTYRNLDPNDRYHLQGREYRLYLPLYNHVQWLEVSNDNGDFFQPLLPRKDKPMVIYGTSIAQGACASRPGMAWTNQLSRAMDRPLVNLGFSGNGLLAESIIDLMTEIDAKVYVLDCLPNLLERRWEELGINGAEGLKKMIIQAVSSLKSKRSEVPVLLVEHAGYTEDGVSKKRKSDYEILNRIMIDAYRTLKEEGYDGIFYLTKEEIGISMDGMVDGTHPTDLGMNQYAIAYEAKLREVLKEKKGMISTTIPITQHREPGNYDWEERHNDIIRLNEVDAPKQVILANSIVHYWGGEPQANIVREEDSWNAHFTPAGVRNLAYGWDRIENVLWRVHHGELDGYKANRVIVMIGTNNLHLNTDEEMLAGLELLLKAISYRQPTAEIVLMGLLPRRDYVDRIQKLNFRIARLAEKMNVRYDYAGNAFINEDGSLNEDLFSDGLHPNQKGYQEMSQDFQRIINP